MSLLTAKLAWPYRGESLDNLDASSSWRSSWAPRSNSYIPNQPSVFSANYGGGSGGQRASTLPSSYSVGPLLGRAGAPWSLSSQQSPFPAPLPATRSPEPRNNAGDSPQRNRYRHTTTLRSCLSPLSGLPTGILLFWCCESRTLTGENVEPELFT